MIFWCSLKPHTVTHGHRLDWKQTKTPKKKTLFGKIRLKLLLCWIFTSNLTQTIFSHELETDNNDLTNTYVITFPLSKFQLTRYGWFTVKQYIFFIVFVTPRFFSFARALYGTKYGQFTKLLPFCETVLIQFLMLLTVELQIDGQLQTIKHLFIIHSLYVVLLCQCLIQ